MAWTITETWEAYKAKHQYGEEVIEIKLDCTSDGSASDYDITNIAKLMGGYLYEVRVVPGAGAAAPTAVFSVAIQDVDNGTILTCAGNSVTAVTYHDGAATIGHYPLVRSKLSVVPGTLGDANTSTIYLQILK